MGRRLGISCVRVCPSGIRKSITTYKGQPCVFYERDAWLIFRKWKYKEIEIGATYKHYKGRLYCIIETAVHTETEEKLVVYQDIAYPENACMTVRYVL